MPAVQSASLSATLEILRRHNSGADARIIAAWDRLVAAERAASDATDDASADHLGRASIVVDRAYQRAVKKYS